MMSAIPVKKAAFLSAAAAGLYGAAVFLYTGFCRLAYPYTVNLGESTVAQATRFLAEGKNPYHGLDRPPYTLVPYGPVYLFFSKIVSYWYKRPYIAGRIVTMAASLALATMIFIFLRKKISNATAFLCALFFLASPCVYLWGAVVNVDMSAVFFSVLAFYFFHRCAEKDFRSRSDCFLGLVFSVTAFFTKSSMLASPAAFFLLLAARRKWKAALGFALAESAAVLLVYAALNAWSGGGYFFHTTYEIAHRQFFPVFIYSFWRDMALQSPLWVAAFFCGLYACFRDPRGNYFGIYSTLVLLLTVSLGKQGSDTNYFLEWSVVSSLALGLWLASVKEKDSSGKNPAAGVLYLLIFLQLAVWIYPHRDFIRTGMQYRKAREFFDRISLYVKKTQGPILSQDMSLLLANGREIFYEPFPMGQMSYSGVWDQSRILAELKNKNIRLAILYFYAPYLKADRNFTPEFMRAFNANYELIGRATPPAEIEEVTKNTLFFYLPKKK